MFGLCDLFVVWGCLVVLGVLVFIVVYFAAVVGRFGSLGCFVFCWGAFCSAGYCLCCFGWYLGVDLVWVWYNIVFLGFNFILVFVGFIMRVLCLSFGLGCFDLGLVF